MKIGFFRIAVGLSMIAVAAPACGGDDEPVVVGGENQHQQGENQQNEKQQNQQGEDNDPQEELVLVPEFFGDTAEDPVDPELTVIADATDQITSPNDLAFHPHEDRNDELWVLNEDTTTTGGSTVTLFDAGTSDQEAKWVRDGNAWHFMALPTALSFGDNGHWATGAGVQDSNHQGGTYSGPTLWSSDFEIYGVVGDPPSQEVNGSHLDMLHGSPFSMGIAHEQGNAYWVYDGYHGYLVRYDFQEPHPPGGHDHSNGLVHRYEEVQIERHDTLPSHMIVDNASDQLFINDTGNHRILVVDVTAGEKYEDLGFLNEPLEEHWEMHNAEWEIFSDQGLAAPTGIALNEERLFVTDHGTGELIAFDVDTAEELDRIEIGSGIRGVTVGPNDQLWLADYGEDRVLRVDPQ